MQRSADVTAGSRDARRDSYGVLIYPRDYHRAEIEHLLRVGAAQPAASGD